MIGMITSNNLVHHEFIGLKVHAVNEKNPSLNLKGTVIDETKNTINIEKEDNSEKVIPKKGTFFVFFYKSKNVTTGPTSKAFIYLFFL